MRRGWAADGLVDMGCCVVDDDWFSVAVILSTGRFRVSMLCEVICNNSGSLSCNLLTVEESNKFRIMC